MALPGVNINILNGQLGRVAASEDGVAGMIIGGVAPSGLTLMMPKQIFTLQDAVDLGIDEAFDTSNSVEMYKQIKQFYDQAGKGQELWIMIVAQTTTFVDMLDKAGNIAPALLDAASGRIRLLGVTRVPDGAYTPTYTTGLDDDVTTAISNAQALANEKRTEYAPLRILIEGRDYQGVPGDLEDLTQRSDNAVMIMLGSVSNTASAALGLALGRASGTPVQRNLGRVKDGDLGIDEAYLGSDLEETHSLAERSAIHNKGYVFLRSYVGKAGYFFSDDVMATATTDDYANLARGRVIDKALRIAYITYVNELLDEVQIDPDTGQLEPSIMKSFQTSVESAIDGQMTQSGEIVAVEAEIDPAQNVLANDQIEIDLAVTPVGYAKTIIVNLGLFNPASA